MIINFNSIFKKLLFKLGEFIIHYVIDDVVEYLDYVHEKYCTFKEDENNDN